jgi:hypothetical protein
MNLHSDISFWLYGAIGIVSSVVVALILSAIIPGERKPLENLTWKNRVEN